ncbi:hydroxysteroid dehydrogenase-like protein 3 [Leptotrombidium deliense]|uniref:Hydroxysteroid dehydrogenase-like protein 3 n=1 Tax=Leptotrombidium deliense TaxID=299467 RepID=A0A443S4P8_9ACAR|nr:hydroxysteroid dehydrogenase-like protein 3 [Leptotrombidium deliense]
MVRFKVFIWSRIFPINLVKRYGEFVVLTGGTDGIGFGLAKQFAKLGHSLVLVGRNPEKLEKTKETIETLLKPGKSVITIVADLSNLDSLTCQKMENSLYEIRDKIGLLVNNAGVFYERPDVFLKIAENDVDNIVKVNVAAVLKMTKIVLPFLVSNKRGIVVNVGSLAAINPTPLFNVYTASKKFLEYFTSALEYEYKNDKVEVQLLQPGIVLTRLADWSKYKPSSLVCPTPDTYAISAIATIGRSNHTTGYWMHGVMTLIISSIPAPLLNFMQDKAFRHFRI